jgi:hypothetical protein
MKWFQHHTDSHTNGKMRQVLRKHGLEGYAFCWICRELVAKEGEKYRIKAEKDWKSTLCEVVNKSIKEVDEWLKFQAEIGAIDCKALEIGDLYIPKLREYSDYCTKRVRREYVLSAARIDKNRIDKIILHYIKEQGWEESIKTNPALQGDIFKRNVRPAKQLLLVAVNDELALKTISKMSKEYGAKKLSWTLETVIKHYAEMNNHKPEIRYE